MSVFNLALSKDINNTPHPLQLRFLFMSINNHLHFLFLKPAFFIELNIMFATVQNNLVAIYLISNVLELFDYSEQFKLVSIHSKLWYLHLSKIFSSVSFVHNNVLNVATETTTT